MLEEKAGHSGYFAWIDILRGLASLGVVLYHARVDLWVGWTEIRANPDQFTAFEKYIALLSVPLPFLGSGVILFFLLSGFCIHFPSVGKRYINVKAYALRRAIRIIPPYIFAVFLSLTVESVVYHLFGQPMSSSRIVYKTLLMVQNYPPEAGQLNSNPSLWSLPVEMQLYLVYPFLLFASYRYGQKKRVLILVGVVSAIASVLSVSVAPWMQNDFLKFWIIWCFGAVLAEYVKRGKIPQWRRALFLPLLGLFSVGIVCVRFDVGSQPARDFIWAGGFFFLIWWCLTLRDPSSFIHPYLLNKLLWLGKISFSLYLVHFPLFKLLGLIFIFINGEKPANLAWVFGGAVAAVMVGGIFYYLVEKPSHQLARYFGKRMSSGVARVQTAAN